MDTFEMGLLEFRVSRFKCHVLRFEFLIPGSKFQVVRLLCSIY